MPSTPDQPQELLVGLLTRHQQVIFRYILSLVPDPASAEDILQETNLVLWRKAAEYDPERPFIPWACRIALFQVMAHRRDKARDPHVFDDDVLEMIAAEAPHELPGMQQSLNECLGRLPDRQRSLILARYESGASVETLARDLRQNANSLSQSLFRIRRALAECIERSQQLSQTS